MLTLPIAGELFLGGRHRAALGAQFSDTCHLVQDTKAAH